MTADLNPSPRLLLGPGPSPVHPRVLRAMSTPLIGYLDPEWLALMDEEQELLRQVFQTKNALTLPLSGTGMTGMEAAMANFVEPGDKVLVGCNGFFGERMCELAARYGAEVHRIEKPWGEVFTPDDIEAALAKIITPAKLVALVHAETSTGALQPNVDRIANVVHLYGSLLLLDTVTSLGGAPLKIDEWGVDIAYSGSQKCLGCPPGLAPFTAGERALEALWNRKSKLPNWYLDLTLLEKYWGKERAYHHTPSTTLHYGFREGLRLVLEEGLENRWRRHRANAEYLWSKLEGLDLNLYVSASHRLPPLTTVQIPNGIDDLVVRARLRDEFNIEIAGGFGPLKGKIWRVGLMGFGSRKENVATLVEALREVLSR